MGEILVREKIVKKRTKSERKIIRGARTGRGMQHGCDNDRLITFV